MTGNLYSTIVIVSAIAIVSIVVLAVSLIIVYHVHKKQLELLISYEINVSATIDEEIPNILEKYVNSIFTDYRLKFLDMQYNELYISDEEQENIRKDFAAVCARRLSPAMMDKLSLFWKRESIAEVLADKIYLIIVDYVVAHNTVKYPEPKEKTNV